MKSVNRNQWGARAPSHRSSIGDVYGCTIHWNGPAVGAIDHSQCDDTVRGFQRFHMDTRGWSDIGYNFLVCRHGHVFEGRGLGIRGAHDESLNAHWYGIQAMVGRGDDLPADLLAGLVDVIAYCRRNGARNRINAHRDADNTACPGDELYAWAHGSPMEDDMPSAEEIAEAVWGHRLKQFASAEDDGWDDGKRRADYILRFAAARAHSAPQRTLNTDMVPVPTTGYSQEYRDGNPNFTLKYGVSHGWEAAEQALSIVRKLAQQSGVEVDEEELAAELLPGMLQALNPSAIAEAVAEALPEYELVPRSTKES